MTTPSLARAIYGPLMIGSALSTFCYGVVVIQMYAYFESSRRSDPRWIRWLVVYLAIVITTHTIFNFMLVYEPLILEFGQVDSMSYVPLYLYPDAIFTAATAFPVQIFMAWRIAVLSGSKTPSFIVIILGLVSFAGATWTTTATALYGQWDEFSNFKTAPMLWLISSAVADILITMCLCLSLWFKKTGHVQADQYVSRVIRITIQTGALTSMMALTDALVFVVHPHTTIFFIWDLSISKLYVIALLSSCVFIFLITSTANSIASLNARNSSNALFALPPDGFTLTTNLRLSSAGMPQSFIGDLNGDVEIGTIDNSK